MSGTAHCGTAQAKVVREAQGRLWRSCQAALRGGKRHCDKARRHGGDRKEALWKMQSASFADEKKHLRAAKRHFATGKVPLLRA